MKYYKFTELSKTAKKVAAINYMDGFNEDREEDDFIDYNDSYSSCIDIDDEMLYFENGTDAPENHQPNNFDEDSDEGL